MGIVVLSVFKGLRQLMDMELEKPRVNTFEVMGCGWERIPCTQGIRRTKGKPCSAKQGNSPTLQGSKTSEPRHLAGVQLDVSMLSEHQDLADVYSGCVTGRVWTSEATVAPVTGRPSAVQATGVHVANSCCRRSTFWMLSTW